MKNAKKVAMLVALLSTASFSLVGAADIIGEVNDSHPFEPASGTFGKVDLKTTDSNAQGDLEALRINHGQNVKIEMGGG